MGENGFQNIFNLACELLQKEISTDVILWPVQSIVPHNASEKFRDDKNLRKNGFPAHQLLLGAASPFLKCLFNEHYFEHRESPISLILPETSQQALTCVLIFIYTGELTLTTNMYEEVLKLAILLKIKDLISALHLKRVDFEMSLKKQSLTCIYSKSLQKNNTKRVINTLEPITDFNSEKHKIKYKNSSLKDGVTENVSSVSIKLDANEIVAQKSVSNMSNDNIFYNENSEALINTITGTTSGSSFFHKENTKPGKVLFLLPGQDLNSKKFLNSNTNENHDLADFVQTTMFPTTDITQLHESKLTENILPDGPPSFYSFPNNSFGTTDLEHTEDDEEKTLNLQGLLKDCEGVDLRGLRNYEKYCEKSDISTAFLKDEANSEEKITSLDKDNGDVSSSEYNQNLLSKEVENMTMFSCSVCSKQFKKKSDREIHEARHKDPSVPCKICGKLFKLKKDLICHMETHKRTHKYYCHQCGKMLTSARNLRQHISFVHKHIKAFKCDHCGKKYGKKADLLNHIRSVHTFEKPYTCVKCNKSFFSSHQLRSHKDEHENPAFRCSVCSQTYKHRASFITHMRCHNMKQNKTEVENVDKPSLVLDCSSINKKHIKCRICNKSFDEKALFEKHMEMSHNEVVEVSEIKVKKVKLLRGKFSDSLKNYTSEGKEDKTSCSSLSLFYLRNVSVTK